MIVYLSHTRSDSQIARALASELTKRNIATSSADELESGDVIASRTSDLLRSSDAIVAILSKHSYSSQWVRKELDEALFNEKFKDRFLPVLLSDDPGGLSRLPWVLQRIKHLKLSPDRSPSSLAKSIAREVEKLLDRRT